MDNVAFAHRAREPDEGGGTPERKRQAHAALHEIAGANRYAAQARGVLGRRVGIARVPRNVCRTTRGEARGDLRGHRLDTASVGRKVVRDQRDLDLRTWCSRVQRLSVLWKARAEDT